MFNYFGIDSVDGGDSSSYFGKLYRIKTYVAATPTTVRQHQKYWWDADGNLTARTDVLAYSETESFSYDFLDRLTGVSNAYSESYAYDEIGNMTSKNSVSYTYGSSAGPHAVTSVGNYTQTYDDNGNMTGRANSTGTQTLTWNVENQLYQVTGTGGGYSGTATYTYDGDGKRIKKVEGNTTTVYVNKYCEQNIVNNTTTDTSYYYLGGKLIATKKGSALEYLHQDSLSSTALSTNSSGSQVSATKYLPFGATRSSSGTLSTSRMFTSQHMDSGSDLYFYNARYYDAALGRFISPDTIVPGASDPQAFNRYSYVLNNPLKYTDPSGHAVCIGEDDDGNPIWMDDDGDLSTDGTIPGAGAPPVQTVPGVTDVSTQTTRADLPTSQPEETPDEQGGGTAPLSSPENLAKFAVGFLFLQVGDMFTVSGILLLEIPPAAAAFEAVAVVADLYAVSWIVAGVQGTPAPTNFWDTPLRLLGLKE